MSPIFPVHSIQSDQFDELFRLHNDIFGEQGETFSQFQQTLRVAVQLWGIEQAGKWIGYTAVWSVPGVDGLLEMDGGILRQYRRQGAGSQLLHHLIAECRQLPFATLSYPVEDVDTAVSHFLHHHHFWVEHEEWMMTRKNLSDLPPIPTSQCSLQTYPRPKAIAEFIRLYDTSFTDTPWNQPFAPSEVEHLLSNASDLLFLIEEGQAVGFVWLQIEANQATIEPIGIVKSAQGKGYGRIFLTSILHKLADENVESVSLGVWANNDKAVSLYQSVGFEQVDVKTYLAIALK